MSKIRVLEIYIGDPLSLWSNTSFIGIEQDYAGNVGDERDTRGPIGPNEEMSLNTLVVQLRP